MCANPNWDGTFLCIIAGRFDRDQTDVLAIEKELTNTIAQTLRIELSPDTAENLERRYAVDPEAHRLYLK